MKLINTTFSGVWPGGKTHADLIINSIGDLIFGMLGWLIARSVDQFY